MGLTQSQESDDAARILLKSSEADNDAKDIKLTDLRQLVFDQKEQNAFDMEAVQEQLWWSLEAKRQAEARLEDMREAMFIMGNRHEQTIADLRQQLQTSRDNQFRTGGNAAMAMPEVERLRQQVQDLTEERNMLQNTLEWKEVHWRTTIEELEDQLKTQAAELKVQYEAEAQELKDQLNGEIADLKGRLDSFQKGSRAAVMSNSPDSES